MAKDQLTIDVEIRGTEKMDRLLKRLENRDAMNFAMLRAAERLRILAMGKTPIYKPQKGWAPEHPPGTTKRSWGQPKISGTNQVSFKNYMPWSGVLEAGLYPEHMVVGTRADGTPGLLIKTQGGVFSKFAQGGIVSPLIRDRDTMTELVNLIVDKLVADLQGAAT